MEPISLTREPSVVVVETKPIAQEDRALLASIVEPTLALHQSPQSPPAPATDGALAIPVGAGIVLSVPAGPAVGFVTPDHGPTRYTTPPPRCESPLSDGEEQEPPPCCESLGVRFDHVVREGAVLDLQRIAADLGELKFDLDGDQQLLLRLRAMVSRMAADLLADPEPDLNGLLPLARSLRKVVVLLNEATRGEVLRDTLCVFSAHAHELSGRRTPQEDPPTPLQLLLARRRLVGSGIVPASPTAETHGKRRRTVPRDEPLESGGPLSEALTSLLELLVSATAPDPFAPDETLLAIGRAFTAIAASVVAMGDKVPSLATAASTLIPRIASLKAYILRLPPGLTEQAIHRLQTLAAEAQAEAHDEKTNPVCIAMIHDMGVAMERVAGALGLLGDACARLVAADPRREDIARLANDELAEAWRALLWMGDALAPVVHTVALIHRSLDSLDRCIDHVEKSLPPTEILQLLGTIMEESLQATRMVARLVKPARDSLLPRLMDSLAHATELASEARIAMDAAAPA
jgi:hypothetical protein